MIPVQESPEGITAVKNPPTTLISLELDEWCRSVICDSRLQLDHGKGVPSSAERKSTKMYEVIVK